MTGTKNDIDMIGVLYGGVWKFCLGRNIFITFETQGQIVGARESLSRRLKKSAKKSLERGKEPLGTKFYRTSTKRLVLFWLLIGARKSLYFSAQSQGNWVGVRFVWSYTEGYTK